MKQSILNPRIHRLAMIFGLLVLFGQSGLLAKGYFLDGPHSVFIDMPTKTPLIWKLTNLIGATQKLHLKIIGADSSLKIYPGDGDFPLFKDSNGNVVFGYITANYIGGNSNIVNTTLILSGQSGEVDTIHIFAQDSRFQYKTPFDLYIDGFAKGTTFTEYSYLAQSLPMEISLALDNVSGYDMDIDISLLGATDRFTIEKNTITVSGSPGILNTKLFTVTYTQGNTLSDTVMVIATSKGSKPTSDTVLLIATDSALLYTPYLPSDTLLFTDEALGSKDCGYLLLTNPFGYPITITDAEWIGDPTNFSSYPKITTPWIIPPYSTDSLYLCYTAPDRFGKIETFELHFTFSGGTIKYGRGYLSAIANTKPCFALESDLPIIYQNNFPFESTIAGGYTDMTSTFTNNTDDDITVTAWNIRFHDNNLSNDITLQSPTFPLTVASGKNLDVTMRFAPKKPSNSSIGFTWWLSLDTGLDSLCSSTNYLYGYGLALSGADTSMHTLFPKQLEVLPMASEKNTTTKTFHFLNNGISPVKVSALYITGGTHFTVTAPLQSDLPIVVQSGASLDVEITFDANTTGFYSDSLVIVTDHALMSQSYHIQAVRSTSALVSNAAKYSAAISIFPNPASALVAIHSNGIQQATIEILDILGAVVATHTNTPEWVWNIHEAPAISKGNYFVRISGFDNDHQPIVLTKRLILD